MILILMRSVHIMLQQLSIFPFGNHILSLLKLFLILKLITINWEPYTFTKGVQKVRGKVPSYSYFVNQLN